MNNKPKIIGLIILSAALGSMMTFLVLSPADSSNGNASENEAQQPLYWVAPMDSNYRRDKPGQSPMGMDLVPVYQDGASNSESGVGTVTISPEVINNLGVRTALVERRALQSKINTVGYVQYDQNQLVHIHPRVEGWIDKLYVNAEGEPVAKGQPLYELYSPALVNAQEELLLALDRKNQRLIKAAEARLAALQIPAEAISELYKTKRVSHNITFYAPQKGVVDNLNIRQGFYVKPGTTMMSVGALEQVWVEAEIFERQVPFVKTETPVTMSLDYLPGEKWSGKVDYIYPTLDAKTRTVKVRLKFDNRDDLLKPNMYAQVQIHVTSNPETLLVPREAVIRTGDQDRVVLALSNGRFKSVSVKLGLQDQNNIEILDGLNQGDKIVISAQFLIDSESSKTSDFKRMQPLDDVPDSVWTSATIEKLMPQNRMLSATHQAIDEWQWPAMTMDFAVDESVDFELLKTGMQLHLEISKTANNSYVISNIHIMQSSMSDDEESVASATVAGIINSINTTNRAINISRGPIAKWDRPEATLDFIAAEKIELDKLKTGMKIQFTFEIRENDFVITEISDPAKHHQH